MEKESETLNYPRNYSKFPNNGATNDNRWIAKRRSGEGKETIKLKSLIKVGCGEEIDRFSNVISRDPAYPWPAPPHLPGSNSRSLTSPTCHAVFDSTRSFRSSMSKIMVPTTKVNSKSFLFNFPLRTSVIKIPMEMIHITIKIFYIYIYKTSFETNEWYPLGYLF